MLTEMPLPHSGIQYFKYAKLEALKSEFRYRVGACLVRGKTIIRGYNKPKTHPIFANPNIHIKKSIHAELDCLSKVDSTTDGVLYVYRETRDGKPAMAKPCEHCMEFLSKTNIKYVYYSIPEFPYWRMEKLR